MKNKTVEGGILEVYSDGTIYHGAVEPSTPIKDDVWFKPNGEIYINEFREVVK